MYPNIERLLQLHQEVQIIYVVDGYQAIFYLNESWDKLAESDVCDTIKKAMANLEEKLKEPVADWDRLNLLHPEKFMSYREFLNKWSK